MTKRIAPWIVFGVFLVYLGAAALVVPGRSASRFDLRDFRRLPVAVGGRVQPIDTLARNALLRISGSASMPVGGSAISANALDADEWLLEVLANPDLADSRPVFPIANRELLEKLSLKSVGPGTTYVAFRDLAGKREEINRQTQRIAKVKAADRASWEREILAVRDKLVIYERLKNSLQPSSSVQQAAKGSPMPFDYARELGRYRADLSEAVRLAALRKEGKAETLDPAAEQRLRSFAGSFQAVARLGLVAAIPPHDGEARNRWRTAGTEIANSARGARLSPAVPYVARMVSAYAQGDAGSFAAAASSYRSWLVSNGLQREVNRAAWEVFYNRLQPMFRAIPLYVLGLVLLFAAGSAAAAGGARGVGHRRPMYEAALLLVSLGFAVHTTGLLFAFTLAGRPSFLVFAGWAIALCGLLVECFSRRGLWLAAAGIGGLAALVATYAFVPGGLSGIVTDILDVRLLAAVAAAGAALLAAVRPSAKPADSPARWVRATTQA